MLKQLLVISGKGGTGKTVISAALSSMAENKVMVDCDVDAADLHLLLNPIKKVRQEFRSGHTALLDQNLCSRCGQCVKICRFDAIKDDFTIDSISCEGCAFCGFICPDGAIRMEENISGEWFISETRLGPLVHARLGIAEENSGKLVSLVRNEAMKLAEVRKCEWIIIDGPPGIGCPVIASLSGVDHALVVTEPTISGLHDADRVIQVASHFGVAVTVLINKYDLNLEMTREIEKFCDQNGIGIIGKIAFDKSVVKAMVEGKTIMEYSGSKVKDELISIWANLRKWQFK